MKINEAGWLELSDPGEGTISRQKAIGIGEITVPEVVVLHYTASGHFQHTVDRLATSPDLSVHFVVGRAGEIVQLVPCDRRAYHAGLSEWKGKERVNAFSIGIEIINWGWLKAQQTNQDLLLTHVDTEVHKTGAVFSKHKNETTARWWQSYTGTQISAVRKLVIALCKAYNLTVDEVVGHNDIAPKRKVDPGPAWPMEEFKHEVAIALGTEQQSIEEVIPTGVLPADGPMPRVDALFAKAEADISVVLRTLHKELKQQ